MAEILMASELIVELATLIKQHGDSRIILSMEVGDDTVERDCIKTERAWNVGGWSDGFVVFGSDK